MRLKSRGSGTRQRPDDDDGSDVLLDARRSGPMALDWVSGLQLKEFGECVGWLELKAYTGVHRRCATRGQKWCSDPRCWGPADKWAVVMKRSMMVVVGLV